ncbi:SagB/ThcOx family dehydrogenase [Rubeoparvulum massiliense]|uniref:SagB/ThcOx family dehydrogenase n=1 Tax=Rubeoparvulum massiliense TaxID=1631346 RepID=UPI00065E618D|nr:SagB/ThcOx family dehydrogenase [Rubeoparvulum massiliense]
MAEITELEILAKKIDREMLDTHYLYEEYHLHSKLTPTTAKALARKISSVFADPNFVKASKQAFKSYISADSIRLPSIERTLTGLDQALLKRETTRAFMAKPLELEEISLLLRTSFGITGQLGMDDPLYTRSYPSAGGLYPIDCYVISQYEMDLVPAGVYHYDVKGHRLECLQRGDVSKEIPSLTNYTKEVENAALLILMTATFPRLSYKYGERGYRFALLEAGHMAQNLYLSATALDIGCMALGGFYDDGCNQLLDVDGINESVIYMLAVGHKEQCTNQRVILHKGVDE